MTGDHMGGDYMGGDYQTDNHVTGYDENQLSPGGPLPPARNRPAGSGRGS
jgi:hypothetical protein